MTYRRLTGLLIITMIFLNVVYDILVDQWGGDPSTISRVLGDAGARMPMVILGAGLLGGALLVHVFDLRQHTAVPKSEDSPDQEIVL